MSIVGGEKIVPVVNLIRDALFTVPFMHIDETPLNAPSIVMHSHSRQILCFPDIAGT
jgi:hypothetical protein